MGIAAFNRTLRSGAARLLTVAGVMTFALGSAMADPSGVLRWGAGFEPQGWNPQVQPNTTYSQLIYEGLLQVAEDGTTIEPRLAEEWTITPTEATFRLREGVVFHDGTPFNADAVIANIMSVKGAANRWQETLTAVKDVVKIDDYNVRFELEYPNPALLYTLTQRGLHMVSPAVLEAGTIQSEPVGTGPYVFNEQASVTGSTYVFDFFGDYYAPQEVGVEKVEVHYFQDASSRYNALLAGQVDAVDGDPTQVQTAESMGLGVHVWHTLRYHLIMLDRKDALGDPRVRKAMCMAMPLEQINQARFGGLLNFTAQRFDEGDPAHVAGLEAYPYDIEAARALMEEAGNPQINVELPSADFMRIISELVKESFGMIGVNVDVITMPAPEYFQSFYSGRYPFIVNAMTAENGGMFNYYPFRFSMDGAANTFDAEPPARLQEAYDEALNAPEEEQSALLQEMTQIIHDEALDCGYMDAVAVAYYNTDRFETIVGTTWEPSALRYRDVKMVD